MSDDPICVIPPEISVICGLLRSTAPGLRAATLTFPWRIGLVGLLQRARSVHAAYE